MCYGAVSSLRGYVLDDRAAVERLVPAWWALLKRAASPQPTQTPLWLMTWWDVMGGDGGRQLKVAVAEDAAGEVVGILPLLRRRIVLKGVIPVQTLELLGSGEDQADEIFSEYIGAVVARDQERAVAARFAEMLQAGDFGHWDDLTMPAMSADDPWVALFADELRARGMKTDVVPDLECRYILLPATWDEYVAGLDGDSRYFVRRTLRDFEAWAKAEGGATLKRVNNDAEMTQGWEILLSGHAERWEGGGAFRSEKFKRFHQTVTRGLLAGTGGILICCGWKWAASRLRRSTTSSTKGTCTSIRAVARSTCRRRSGPASPCTCMRSGGRSSSATRATTFSASRVSTSASSRRPTAATW